MIQSDWYPRVGVIFGYLLAALAFSWPLPLHLGTALTGDPGGDTGVYIWNQWVFQHEALVRHHNPLRTEQILSLTDPVDLSQHNYTAFLNLLALPLISWLGVVRAFNVVFLVATVLTALTTYALARAATSASRFEAWLAGLVFAWSPVLVARSVGHFSLVAAAPLALFLLCLIRADRSQRARDAAFAGLCVAWAAFCDVYYAIYCLIIVLGYLMARAVRISYAQDASPRPWRWALDVLIVSVAGLTAGLLVGRGGRFEILGTPVSIRGLYTPVFVLTALVIARMLVQWRPRLSIRTRQWSPATLWPLLIGVLACAGPLSPVLYGLGERLVEGRLANPPIFWRSSPRGVDALAFFEPNPNHPAVRAFIDRQSTEPTVFVEYTAAFSLVALGVIAFAVWRARYRPRAGWLWLTVGFAALALGPFVYVAGTNTHIPGPWALLRYVPIVGMARTPTRFAVVAALGLAILLAGALAALGARYPGRRRLIAVTVGALLTFELLPAPRTLYSAAIPSVYDVITADPRPIRVLQLPFGVRDGVSSAGNFSARYQYYQTIHRKKLIGGYLSRISKKRLNDVRSQPTLDALMTMSEGGVLTPEQAAIIRARAPRFIRRSNVGYVVIDHRESPRHLVEFVIDAWGLQEVARDGPIVLYRPTVGLAADAGQ